MTEVPSIVELVEDLAAETADLDRLLAPLSEAAWSRPTPAEGWTVRDQVTHLAYFDDACVLTATEPDRFRGEAAGLTPDFPDRVAAEHRHLTGAGARQWWLRSRAALLAAFAGLDPKVRLPWYGPDMSPTSALTARLMETWAHGQDVADALGDRRAPTDRLRHVAHLGVRTRGFSFALRGLSAPVEPVAVRLVGPGGDTWSWDDDDAAADVVSGPALDFCLVVTQRRALGDTALDVRGPAAQEWMAIAQAFAGAPGRGRAAVSHLPKWSENPRGRGCRHVIDEGLRPSRRRR